jgi:poly-gamma-glutamate capsule biosynthesis protein CapA/YwtB (metallophosphatase superfamily)
MSNSLTFTATGDSFITRTLPQRDRGFEEVSSIIKQAQVRFTNLEVTTHPYEGFPSAFSGGTWAIAPPYVLEDIKDYGFNLIAWANNHTLDYSYGGLEATKKYLDQYRLIHAGVGDNLAEATSPKYLECPTGRVALIAATATFHESWVAGDQRPDIMGRPGINPLRFSTNHVVSKERLEQLKKIADMVDINAQNKLAIKEGFTTEDDENSFMFGKYQFSIGEVEGMVRKPLEKDMQRILKGIVEANQRADYCIVSIHSHEMSGNEKDQPADFIREFAKKCIDAGAHAVIGHGPHILQGIEIYKNRPIFYSLGNFIFHNETVEKLPADFYEKYGLGYEQNTADALSTRTKNGTVGLGVNPNVWESIIPYWTMENGELGELKLYPIELGFDLPSYRMGWPKMSKSTAVLEKLQGLSSPYGTTIKIENSIGYVVLNK